MASVPSDIYFNTIPEINQRLQRHEFTAVELTRAFSDRLEQLGPRYNALACSLRKPAIQAAKDTDWYLKADRFKGPLQGVPFGAKDLLAYPKYPTTWGAKPYANQILKETAQVLNKLFDPGAVLIGKLAMVELAGGGGYRYAGASLTGPGLNPWDITRWSGGSSSGSATAVAAGLVAFALGSETSGSILTPCAFCGVTGLRPTYGLVSRRGAMALSWTMDKIGPICRSADDCGYVLHSMAGGDDEDPGSAGKSFYYAPQYARKMQDLRVGFAAADFEQWAEPAARPAFAEALKAVRALGVQMTGAKLPDFPYDALTTMIIDAEAGSVFEPLIASGAVEELADQTQIAGLKASLSIPAKDYLRAMRLRSLVQQGFNNLFADIDVLLTPTRFGPAPKISEPLDQPGFRPATQDPGLSKLVEAGNLAGLPALSLPCGFADGLPLGISLVGRPFSENTLLAVGREFQKATDWHRRRPPEFSAG